MKSLGHNVEAFSCAADFLASPRLVETACLIADVQMPAMTGIQLYKHLIDNGHAIPTILVTAYPDDDARVRALNEIARRRGQSIGPHRGPPVFSSVARCGEARSARG